MEDKSTHSQYRISFLYLWNVKERTRYIGKLIRQNINTVDSAAVVILYGSRAKGNEHTESDWDILVLTDYPVDLKMERKFRDNLYELELETGEPFSIFVYSKSDWNLKQRITPFYYNVMQDGIKL